MRCQLVGRCGTGMKSDRARRAAGSRWRLGNVLPRLAGDPPSRSIESSKTGMEGFGAPHRRTTIMVPHRGEIVVVAHGIL